MTTKTIKDDDLTELETILLKLTEAIHKAVSNAGFVTIQDKDPKTGEIIIRTGVRERKDGSLEVVRTEVLDSDE